MSEYRITLTNIPPQHTTELAGQDEYDSVLIHICPPVPLNSDAVERYLAHGNLEPVERDIQTEITDVVVLGSTDEQTTIHASLLTSASEKLRQEVAESTVRYLGFMGAQVTVDTP
jgi:hypothetical protein